MRTFYYFFAVVLMISFFETDVYAQCERFANPVFNFANSNVGEELCDGEEGCDAGGFEITGFEVWINEAYLLGKLYPGAEYVFDICEGYDPNTWKAELTAIEYIDGDTPIIVEGAVMGTVQDCQLIFTVPNSYVNPVDVMVIISEAGNCGGDLIELDNGFPFFGCGANGGQPACNGEVVSCDDSNVTAGVIDILNDGSSICVNDTLFFRNSGAIAPNEGAVSGFSWLISTENLNLNPDPFANPDIIVGGYPVVDATEDIFIFIHDGDFEVGSYFFTPIVFGNGTGDVNDPIFNITLDPSCTFVGKSVEVNLLAEDDPACTACVRPTVDIFSSECDETGLFELEVDVIFGSADSYTVIDSLSGYSQTLTSDGTVVLGPYEGGEMPIWVLGDGESGCRLRYNLAEFCPVVCNVVANMSFEESGNWTEFEQPDQPNFTIIDNTLPMTGEMSAYLGGYEEEQITNISQTVTLPINGNATLSFYGLFFCSDDSDNFKVLMDGEPILDIFGSNEELCSAEYFTRFELDVSSYADGSTHTIQFSLFGADSGFTAFFVDDVQLNACACIANSGTLQIPDETTLCGNVAGDFEARTNGNEYIGALSAYLFLLVDSDGNIVANSDNGSFDFSNVASGDYEVRGLSLLVSDVATVQDYTHIDQIQGRLEFGSLCADFTETTYTLSYDADCVGIEEVLFEKDFEITSMTTLKKGVVKVDFQAKKQTQLQAMLYDVNGRLLQSQRLLTSIGENEIDLTIPSMNSGMYLLVLTDGRSLVSRRFLSVHSNR